MVLGASANQYLKIVCCILILAGGLDQQLQGAAGDLDLTFGWNGVVRTKVGLSNDEGHHIAIGADDKILVAGSSMRQWGETFSYLTACRFNPDGSLDPSFGDKGTVSFLSRVSVLPGGAIQAEQGLLMMPDGRPVLGGTLNDALGSNLLRLNTDGSLDSSFGKEGVGIPVNFSGTSTCIATQSTGKIVQGCAYAYANAGQNVALTRYNSNGTWDTGFGVNGVIIEPSFDGFIVCRRMVIDREDKIIFGGYFYQDNGGYDFYLARYNPDGDRDTDFGDGGKVRIDFGSRDDLGYAVALQNDGCILMGGGVRQDGRICPALVRLKPDGSLDEGFGGTGKVTTPIASGAGWVMELLVQSDGKIVAAGSLASTTNTTILLARYHANGNLDESFGTHGITEIPVDGGPARTLAATLDPTDRVLVVGYRDDEAHRGELVLRFTTNGVLDESFGTAGIVKPEVRATDDHLKRLGMQSGDRVVAAGQTTVGNYPVFGMVRYLADGQLDPQFGTRGRVIGGVGENFNDLVIQPDDRIVTAGNVGAGGFWMARFETNGQPDLSFGDNGATVTTIDFYASATALALQPDGRILLGGSYIPWDAYSAIAFARYQTNGQLDETFGVGGIVTTNFGPDHDYVITRMMVRSDGKVVVGGNFRDLENLDAPWKAMLLQFNTNGCPDFAFGESGLVFPDMGEGESYVEDMYLQPDGRLMVLMEVLIEGQWVSALVRFGKDGTLDTSFGTQGVSALNTSDYSIELMRMSAGSDGRITATGVALNSNLTGVAVIRFNGDGTVDSAFAHGGYEVVSFEEGYTTGEDAVVLSDGKVVIGADYRQGDFVLMKFLGTNHAPVAIQLDNCSILEGQPAGSLVGKLSVIDADLPSDVHSYALDGGADFPDNAFFQIEGERLQTIAPLTYRDRSMYRIRVSATDSGGATVTNTFSVLVLPRTIARNLRTKVQTSEDNSLEINLAVSAGPEQSGTGYRIQRGPLHGRLDVADSSVIVSPAVLYTPDADYFGPDAFSYIVMNGRRTLCVVTVSIEVVPVNDAPVLKLATSEISLRSPTANKRFAVSILGRLGVSPGPSNERAQAVTLLVGVVTPGALQGTPVIDQSGRLNFVLPAHAKGRTVLSIQAKDNGGTEHGGQDTSPPQSFTIVVGED